MDIARILAGLVMLVLGRRLFWLFVAALGFVIGADVAAQYFTEQPGWLVALAGLGAGIVGALLAVFLQRLAVGAAGFITGGYITATVADALGMSAGQFQWILFVIGGVIGALLVSIFFDWALILLSSLAGSIIIVEAIHLEQWISAALLAALIVIGIVAQTSQLHLASRKAP